MSACTATSKWKFHGLYHRIDMIVGMFTNFMIKIRVSYRWSVRVFLYAQDNLTLNICFKLIGKHIRALRNTVCLSRISIRCPLIVTFDCFLESVVIHAVLITNTRTEYNRG